VYPRVFGRRGGGQLRKRGFTTGVTGWAHQGRGKICLFTPKALYSRAQGQHAKRADPGLLNSSLRRKNPRPAPIPFPVALTNSPGSTRPVHVLRPFSLLARVLHSISSGFLRSSPARSTRESP
jgi:hypothetical protein